MIRWLWVSYIWITLFLIFSKNAQSSLMSARNSKSKIFICLIKNLVQLSNMVELVAPFNVAFIISKIKLHDSTMFFFS